MSCSHHNITNGCSIRRINRRIQVSLSQRMCRERKLTGRSVRALCRTLMIHISWVMKKLWSHWGMSVQNFLRMGKKILIFAVIQTKFMLWNKIFKFQWLLDWVGVRPVLTTGELTFVNWPALLVNPSSLRLSILPSLTMVGFSWTLQSITCRQRIQRPCSPRVKVSKDYPLAKPCSM